MDRTELKKRVRALLISSKQGSTPNGLLKDYKSVFGEGLPLNEFGYRTVVQMAHDMPDVVRIQGGGGNGVLLRGIADESTKHIAKMVSRQRNTGFHYMKADQPARSTFSRTASASGPSIPFHIQGCLRQLMHAYPNGLPLEQFEEAYARRFGYYLSVRLNCNSLQELIHGVPDVLKTNKDAAGRTVIVEANKTSFNSMESDTSSSRSLSRPTRLENHSRILEGQSVMRISDQLSNYDDTSPTSEEKSKLHNSQPAMNYSSTNGSPQSPSVVVPTKIRENILKLLHSKHLGIWCTSLQEEYKNMFGHDLELGPFRNILELLSNMKDICVMEKPNINSGDWLVRSIKQPPQVAPEDTKGDDRDFKSPGSFKEHIASLMLDYPAGIQLQELSTLFKKKYKFELPVEKLGFNSVASLVNSISDVVKKVIQNGQLLILPVTKASTGAVVCSNSNGEVENDVFETNGAVETDGVPVTKKASPKKVIVSQPSVEPVMSSEYTPLVLPHSTNTINVTVSHTINPSKFFIQLIGKDHSMLNTLMMTISKFYCSVTSVEKAIARPVLGQACCALFDGDGCWYRAEIIGIPTPFTVLVKYVDYGNVCELPIGSIRKSQPEFLMLPMQCMECCLADVKSKERVWSEEACKVFQEAVIEKPLVAFIRQAIMGHPLHITLCDTSTKEDVYIHELLINKGLASAVEHEQLATPTSSDAFMLSQFKEQFYTLQQTLLLQQKMLQQQLLVSGQLHQNGQVNGNESAHSWQPQASQPSSQRSQPPISVASTNSEHRKKMAAAKDIWSSDSDTEDEKLDMNGNITKQLESKLERLNEERRNILERMTYNSSSGSISSWVEKLQNIEGLIKTTQENLKRRANGLPPLPPPGLSHMQPAKQLQQQHQMENHTNNPKGVTSVSKPIIGLGRGKRFTKQNSLPVGIGETASVSSPPVRETPVFPVFNNSDDVLVQNHPGKSRLRSDSDMNAADNDPSMKQRLTSRNQSQFTQPITSNEILNQDQSNSPQHVIHHDEFSRTHSHLFSSGTRDRPMTQHMASNNEVFNENLLGSSNEVMSNNQQHHSANNTKVFNQIKSHQLSASSEIFEPAAKKKEQSNYCNKVSGQGKLQQLSNITCEPIAKMQQQLNTGHDKPKKQHQMVSNSKVFDQNQQPSSSGQKLTSNKSEERLQEHLNSVTSKQPLQNEKKANDICQSNTSSVTSINDRITKSFSKLSFVNAPPFIPAGVASTTTHLSTTSQVSAPVVSSRAMSYSSAVTSQPPRKPHPPPSTRPHQPFNKMPLMYQHHPPPPLLPLQPMYGHSQPPVIGLGRGVDPWLPGPSPNSRGGNGHYMSPPMHFNFDPHHNFYEVPSSGLPFYPIPPMGSSSGLDII